VHLGRTENDPIGGTEIAEKALHGLDGGAILLATFAAGALATALV